MQTCPQSALQLDQRNNGAEEVSCAWKASCLGKKMTTFWWQGQFNQWFFTFSFTYSPFSGMVFANYQYFQSTKHHVLQVIHENCLQQGDMYFFHTLSMYMVFFLSILLQGGCQNKSISLFQSSHKEFWYWCDPPQQISVWLKALDF